MTEEPDRSEFVDIAIEAKEKFEEQFDCKLKTGQGSHFEESEPELAEEYIVKGLIETPAVLPVTVAGRIYVREDSNGDKSANCLFTVTLDNQTKKTRHGREVKQELAENKGFQAHYDVENQEWNELSFMAY